MADIQVTAEFSDLKDLNKEMLKTKAEAAILAARNKRLQDSFKGMSPAIDRVNREMQKHTILMSQSGKAVRRNELAYQQAGYQLQDFLVQIQSGTNPIVAFSQQFSQLAGFFAGPWGAVLGLGVAAVGGLALAMQKLGDEAKTAEDSLKDLEDILGKVNDASDLLNLSTDEMIEKYGRATGIVNQFSLAQAEAAAAMARQALNDQIVAMDAAIGKYSEATRVVDDFGESLDISSNLRSIQEDFGVTSQSAIELFDALQALDEAQDFEQQKSALLAVDSLLKEVGVTASDLPPEFNRALFELRNVLFTAEELEQAMLRVAAAAQGMTFGNIDALSGLSGNQLLPPKKIEAPSRSRGGGRKSPAEQLEEYMKKQENLVELQTRQIGLSEEQARIEELKNKYVLAGIEPNMQRIQALAAEEEQLRKTTEAEQKRKSMMDTIEGHITNGFMAMIDGSSSVEDAFKGMLRNILLEIYRQQVAKPIGQGISSLLSRFIPGVASANGNAFFGGRLMPFANGGVVSSPTLFPMANGTGLMGEAGPEAIMPLKRGPNGKLGVEASGGQQVVVNQSFNFSANGDESVKKIIAQAAPQIAQMTQKQIMDSRRRGGQMKAAFS